MQDRTEEPDPPLTDVGFSVQERFVELVATDRVTVFEKPLIGDTVTVDVPALAAFTVTLVGLVETLKSLTLTVRVTECDRPALVAVIVNV